MGYAMVYGGGLSSAAKAKLENFAGKGTFDAVFEHFGTYCQDRPPMVKIPLDSPRDYLIFCIRQPELWHELRFLWHKHVVEGCTLIDPQEVHGYLVDRMFDRKTSETYLQVSAYPIADVELTTVSDTIKRWDPLSMMIRQIQRSIKYYLPARTRLVDDLLMVEYLAEADPEKSKLP